MRVLFITNGGNDPSGRVRVEQFLPLFRRHLDRVYSLPLHGRWKTTNRIRQMLAVFLARFADVVVLQKNASPKHIRAIAKGCARVIYDLDDGVFLQYPELNESFAMFEWVIAGNGALREHVTKCNAKSVVIPSVVDENRFPLKARDLNTDAAAPLVIGWIGNGTNLQYLSALHDAFVQLNKEFPNRFLLKIVCSEPLLWDDVPVQNKTWRLEDEYSDIRSFDIGIMPLADDEWSRFKCGYKALLYMSQGIATMVSPVGVNSEIVIDGIDGFHATDSEEWFEKLRRLLMDPKLRQSMGEAGIEKVRQHYTMAAVLPNWLAVLEGKIITPSGRLSSFDKFP